MGNIVRVAADKLDGSEVTTVPPHMVGLSEAIQAQNTDPRDLRGAVTRNGRAQHGVDNGSGVAVAGLKSWTRDNGTTFLFARLATTFYDVSAAAWASIGIGGTTGELFRAVPLNDTMVIVVDGLAPQKFTTATLSALGGTPPSEAKYAAIFVSKVFLAGDDANPQTKTFSKTNDPENYTATDDAGSITTQDGGGDTIQGLAANNKVLLTFYRNFVDVLIGDGPFNFREERLLNRGLASKTGYASVGEVVFFASDEAIYMVAGTTISDLTTARMRKTYQDISDKSKISLGVKGDLLLVVDYGADTAYACAYKYARWSEWTGQSWQIMDTANDQTFYAGHDGGSTTQIWKLDSGSLDGASTLTCKWRGPNLDFGWSDAPKNLVNARIHAKPGIGTVTLTFYKNGVSTGSTNDLSFASTGDSAWGVVHGQSALRAQYIGMQIQWTGIGTIYGWALYAELSVDGGQIPTEA